ncbi:hypothetical protein THRCLA_11418 [Thraustotheca clavata]|uniref:SPRY domain-containing protein n=1 Tax=Thraustotheca clavata TaxID=74557 RepID=A0A1V9Y7S0_9STRA|nr:hypothetical protein THRCLA_11418 [Thraustotheca clavata]
MTASLLIATPCDSDHQVSHASTTQDAIQLTTSQSWQTYQSTTPTLTYSISFNSINCQRLRIGMSSLYQPRNVFGLEINVRTGAVLWSSERNVRYDNDAAYVCDDLQQVLSVQHNLNNHEMHFKMNGKSMGFVLRDVPEECIYPTVAAIGRSSVNKNGSTYFKLSLE